MAMVQTAFKTGPSCHRHSTAVARWSQRAGMPLFQAFLRPSSGEVTDGLYQRRYYDRLIHQL